MTVPSPCIGCCSIHAVNECRGCGRTVQEIQDWHGLHDDEKQAVLDRLHPRTDMTQDPTFSVKPLSAKAYLPSRGSIDAAGFDLYCTQSVDIPPGRQAILPTDIAVAIPHGWYGRIAPRSGLAVRHGINVHAGVIDADYRGELRVALQNHGDDIIEFRGGDRIAQLIIERCSMGDYQVVDELPTTERGTGSFGSTGR